MKKKRELYERMPLLIFGSIFLLIFLLSVLKKFVEGEEWLVYADSLELVVADVNGQELTLRDLAFYIAYDEMFVEEQAQIYDAVDTSRYWNLKINNVYVRQLSKQSVMEKAVHDEIFYQLAMAEKLELTQEEEVQLSNVQDAFWDNVMDNDKLERLGVTEKDLNDTLRK